MGFESCIGYLLNWALQVILGKLQIDYCIWGYSGDVVGTFLGLLIMVSKPLSKAGQVILEHFTTWP